MSRHHQPLILIILFFTGSILSVARADGSLNTTRPPQAHDRGPADTLDHARGPATSFEARKYDARGRVVIQYRRDSGDNDYGNHRRHGERYDYGHRNKPYRYNDHFEPRYHRRQYDKHGYYREHRDYKDYRNRDYRMNRSCVGNHCYDQAKSGDGDTDFSHRQD